MKSFEQLLQLRQHELMKVMSRYLKTKYSKIYDTADYVLAVGDIPVALVAHLDTVFMAPPKNIFYDRVKNVMWSPEGLGADDRAGIFSIIQLIKRGLRPSIILTTNEESGALGASKLVQDFPNSPFPDLKYIIQLDRRGINDCVFYDCDNPLFAEYVQTFGFQSNYGTFSDISKICPAWQVAGVNLSIGYMDEHSYEETLYVSNMFATIDKVSKMLKDAHNIVEKYDYIPKVYHTSNNWDPSYGISKSLWDEWTKPEDNIVECQCCGLADFEYNIFPTKKPDGGAIFLCADCVSDDSQIGWCAECGTPFIRTGNENICCDCAKGAINNV